MNSWVCRSAVMAVLAGSLLAAGSVQAPAVCEDPVGGRVSRMCRAGIWAMGVPSLRLVGAGLIWLGC